jgi:hypothetical protein
MDIHALAINMTVAIHVANGDGTIVQINKIGSGSGF